MDLVLGPIVGAFVGSSLAMIMKVIEEALRGNTLRRDEQEQLIKDKEYIKKKLDSIKILMSIIILRFSPSMLESHKISQRHIIKMLAGLADRIEDCGDRYNAGMRTATQFVGDIKDLKADSEQVYTDLVRDIEMAKHFSPAHTDAQLAEEPVEEDSRRSCLQYSCMFPPDHPAKRNALIRIWEAEGVADDEQYAIRYLNDLVRENNIQSIEKSNNGNVKICRPTEEGLLRVSQHPLIKYSMLVRRDHVIQEAEQVRRLYFYPNGVYPFPDEAADVKLNLSQDLSHLRTLAIFPGDHPANCKGILKFSSYEVLRLLDLKKCHHMKENHLDAICGLFMLKYLSFGSIISRIPRKISNLQQLETLDMGRSRTVMVFAEIFWLPKLKHLLGKFKLHPLDFYFKEKKIRDFLSTGPSVLQTLSGFATGKRRGFPQLMISMTKLKKVQIWCEATADKENKDHLVEGINKFIVEGDVQHTTYRDPALPTKDRSLAIDFTEASDEFLRQIQVATGRLTSLKLRGKLTNNHVPPIVTSTHIVELCLSSTTLDLDTLVSSLGGLDSLQYLKLIEDNLGPFQIQPEQFRGLKRICIVGKQSLGLIEIKARALPQLVSLRLNCEAQSLQGITIEVEAVPNLVSLHLLSEPLDDVSPDDDVRITSRLSLEEVTLYDGVDERVKTAWRTAINHPNNPPRLSFISKAS